MMEKQMENRGSVLQFEKANCKNCYKCVRNCPVQAVRIRNHQAAIIEERCILCEKCTLVCPQKAKKEINQIPMIQAEIRRGKNVIACVHPAYPAQYGKISFGKIKSALLQMGFTDACDASEGGSMVRRAYERLLKEKKGKTVISSHCSVITLLIERYFPELLPNLAPIPTIGQAQAAIIREKYPDAVIVYVSPCISAIAETMEDSVKIDYVITFTELENWMKGRRISPAQGTGEEETDFRLSRIMAFAGGLSLSMQPDPLFHPVFINGTVNCINVLKELQEKSFENCFLDLSACINGCIGGPSFRKGNLRLLDSIFAVRELSLPESGLPDPDLDEPDRPGLLSERHFKPSGACSEDAVDETAIRAVLEQMGKKTVKDELNCGACGYNTCREKAIAVHLGKAEISMCVPFMQAKQENYSKKIIDAMPGLLVTLDYDLNIVYMNKAAQDTFDISRNKQLIGRPISEIMDDYAMVTMISFEKKLVQDQVILADGRTTLDRVITNDISNQMLLCVMKDITREKREQKEREMNRYTAANMADQLMTEQLRLVHQIAELLGETAADTKVAVERLKNTIMQEREEL